MVFEVVDIHTYSTFPLLYQSGFMTAGAHKKAGIPVKQWTVTDCSILKKLVLCSGNSSKFLLIMSTVHSNRADIMGGMSVVARVCRGAGVQCLTWTQGHKMV